MKNRRELYQQFLKEFPIESLNDMPLHRYTNLNRTDSFCYWLESKTDTLGSIWGGSSYKFGIFKFDKTPKRDNNKYSHDENYSWSTRLGNTSQEAFNRVRNAIVKIANHARKAEWNEIEKIDELWPITKWKIAFLYSNEQIPPIYDKKGWLIPIAIHLGFNPTAAKRAKIPALYKFLLEKKGEKDIYLFYDELRQIMKEKADSSKTVKEPDSATNQRSWWIVSNPKIWSISDMPVGSVQSYTLYNENGNRRRIFQNFMDAQEGDPVIGYESAPTKQIVALAVIDKPSDGKSIYIRKTESLTQPLDYSTIKNTPELSEIEFMRNLQGTFFKLQENEYHTLIDIIREMNPINKEKNPLYNEDDFLKEVFMEKEQYARLKSLLLTKKNIILQGAPGVGKTFCAKKLAYSIMGEKDTSRVEFVQFHQSYTYEDFIMGYKPNENGGFYLKRGIFYNFCKKAKADPSNEYFFIIDEINRGNLSKIFGELLMLIEKEYREEPIKLAYTDIPFDVPKNLYIIGMMNTADRSLAMIDYALRRRFSFFEMHPAFQTKGFREYQQAINSEKFNRVIEGIISLNKLIVKDESLGQGFCIGHSYFCNQKEVNTEWIQNVIDYDILPMIREYWFDNDQQYEQQSEKLKALLK